MAKLPKIGGLRPDDPSYKQLLEGLQKREQAMTATAGEQQKASESVLTESISYVIHGIKKSIESAVDAIEQSEVRSIQQENEKRAGGKQNIFTELLEVNYDILNATLSNKSILEDILLAMNNLRGREITQDYKESKINAGTGVVGRKQKEDGKFDLSSLGGLSKLLATAAGALFGYFSGQIKAIKAIAKTISNIIESLSGVVKKVVDFVKKLEKNVTDITRSVNDVVKRILDFFKNKVSYFIKNIEDAILNARSLIAESKIGKFVSGFINSITSLFENIRYQMWLIKRSPLVTNVTESIIKAFDFVTKQVSRISGVITTVGEGIGRLAKIFEPIILLFTDAGREVKGLFSFVEELFKPIRSLSRYFGLIGKAFTRVAGLASKLFAPIGIIVAAFETISGAIEGYKEGGILGALEGAVVGLFEGTLGGLADLVKDLTSWIFEQLGFENVSKFLDSFSFTDLFRDLVHAFLHPIETLQKLFEKLPDMILNSIPNDWLREQVRDLFGMGSGGAGVTNQPPSSQYSPSSSPSYGSGQQMGYRSVTPVTNPSSTTMANQSAQQAVGAAAPPVVVNNNTVNNNNVSGGSSSDNRIGGVILTTPPQSHIDRSIYGFPDLHSATP